MIEDIAGAASVPPRRRHVAVLSAAAATVALVLLGALLGSPPRQGIPRLAGAPAPSATAGSMMLIDSGGVGSPAGSTWVRLDQVVRMPNDVTSDNVTLTECVPGIGSSAPVHLVLDGSGRVIAAYSSGGAGRFLPLPPGFGASGWLTVPCDTSGSFAPRINRAR